MISMRSTRFLIKPLLLLLVLTILQTGLIAPRVAAKEEFSQFYPSGLLGKSPKEYAKAGTHLRKKTARTFNNSHRRMQAVLENNRILMEFDEQNGNLCSFVDKESGINLLSARDNARKVTFGLEYRRKRSQELTWTDNCRAQQFSYKILLGAEVSEFTGVWRYHWDSGGANVILTITLPFNSTLSRWKIKVLF